MRLLWKRIRWTQQAPDRGCVAPGSGQRLIAVRVPGLRLKGSRLRHGRFAPSAAVWATATALLLFRLQPAPSWLTAIRCRIAVGGRRINPARTTCYRDAGRRLPRCGSYRGHIPVTGRPSASLQLLSHRTIDELAPRRRALGQVRGYVRARSRWLPLCHEAVGQTTPEAGASIGWWDDTCGNRTVSDLIGWVLVTSFGDGATILQRIARQSYTHSPGAGP